VRAVVGHGIEPEDEGVVRRGQRQLHVAFGDAADARVQEADAHLVVVQFFEFFADGFDEPRKSP